MVDVKDIFVIHTQLGKGKYWCSITHMEKEKVEKKFGKRPKGGPLYIGSQGSPFKIGSTIKILIYANIVFLLPHLIFDDMDKIMNRFW